MRRGRLEAIRKRLSAIKRKRRGRVLVIWDSLDTPGLIEHNGETMSEAEFTERYKPQERDTVIHMVYVREPYPGEVGLNDE